MGYDPRIHHRRSIRLAGYDYSQPGAYYITMVVFHRECLFGDVVRGEMRLWETGEIARDEWLRTPVIRPKVGLDQFMIMPNHFHGIIVLRDERNGDNTVRANRDSPQRRTPFRSPSGTIGAIIRGFKSASAKRINNVRGTPGAPVWQRNYYEHIVRDEDDLNRIREYITMNPLNWTLDDNNPKGKRISGFAK